MQNAKDTFFQLLQSRLAAVNPARTIVVRGQVRPAALVEENELPSASVSTDAFRLDWTELHLDFSQALPLATMQCSIRYATDGTLGNGGMDRGRSLAAMDGEIASALAQGTHSAVKLNFSSAGAGTPPVSMATSIFWAKPVFGPCEVVGERLARTTTVAVCCYQEAGEL